MPHQNHAKLAHGVVQVLAHSNQLAHVHHHLLRALSSVARKTAVFGTCAITLSNE